MKDEYVLLEFRSMIIAIHALLKCSDMLPFDAFRVFDVNRDGLLSCSELLGGLTWLGLRLNAEDVYSIMRHIDTTGVGRVTFGDFEKAFSDPRSELFIPDRLLRRNLPLLGEMKVIAVQELYQDDEDIMAVKELSKAALKNMKVKVKEISAWRFVWSSKSTKARRDVSIWAPDFEGFKLRQNKAKICLGHYAAEGFGNPKKNKPPLSLKGFYLELTDDSSSLLFKSRNLTEAHVNFLLPMPIKYKRVWTETSGQDPLYVWRATPPSDEFVALGMMCTTEEVAPAPNAMRCVPLSWVNAIEKAPRMVWDDSGTGGRRGSFWVANQFQLLLATEGHGAPTIPMYDLVRQRFYALEVFNTGSHHSRHHSVSISAKHEEKEDKYDEKE